MAKVELSGASGKLRAIPWAKNSLLYATLSCDRYLSKYRTHLADASLSNTMVFALSAVTIIAASIKLGTLMALTLVKDGRRHVLT